MLKMKKTEERILARSLARELSKDELRHIAGGGFRSSTKWSSSTPEGEGDDGGADD
jgi:hypothetical protein